MPPVTIFANPPHRMTFGDLAIGAVFEFDHTGLPIGSGIARGPWIKTSARKYDHVEDANLRGVRVGTVRARVVPVQGIRTNPVRSNPRRPPSWLIPGYPVSVGAYDGHIAWYSPDTDTVGVVFYDKPGTEHGERVEVPRKKVKARHPQPNPNPPRRSRGSRARQVSRRVYEIRYQHAGDMKNYKHVFRPGVCAEQLPDGSVRLYHRDGKPLMRDF